MAAAVFDDTVRLVQAAQSGDAGAREELFERYLPRARQVAALKLGRRSRELEEADDVVQEALLSALKGFDGFELRDEAGFRNWLTRIVENCIRSSARRASAEKRGGGRVRSMSSYDSAILSSSVLVGDAPTPSKAMRGRELEQALESALLQLDERQRAAVVMRRLEERSYEDVAEALGLSGAASARSLFARAMNRLSTML